MSTLILTGQYFNQLARGTVTTNGTTDTNFPLTYLYDGRPAKPFRNADTAFPGFGLAITLDGNHISNVNGGFETAATSDATKPYAWGYYTSGAGAAVALSTAAGTFNSGTRAVGLTASSSSDYALVYLDLVVTSGQVWNFEFWSAGLTGRSGAVIQNLDTANSWVNTSRSGSTAYSVWSPASTAGIMTLIATSTSYTHYSEAFQVEDFNAVGNKDLTKLRIAFVVPQSTAGNGTAYFDDFAIWPSVNFASVHWHNFPAIGSTDVGAMILEGSSSSGITFSRQGIISSETPNAYTYFTGITLSSTGTDAYRYVRLRLGITNAYVGATGQIYLNAPYIGELVFGQARILESSPLHPVLVSWTDSFERPQTRGTNIGRGTLAAYPYGTNSIRTVKIPFRNNTDAEFRNLVQETILRSNQGQYPIVVVPDTSKPDAIYGRLPSDFSATRFYDDAWDDALEILEEGGPLFFST